MAAISRFQETLNDMKACGLNDPQGEAVGKQVDSVYGRIEEAKQLADIVKIAQEIFDQLNSVRGVPTDPKTLGARARWIQYFTNHLWFGSALERALVKRADLVSSKEESKDQLLALVGKINVVLNQLSSFS